MVRFFSKRAFTLIELLIVVAIIAILAAIAVPNFLEAQMRAKVARVKGDLRTVSMALEAYSIDYNGNYPHIKAYKDANIQGQYNRAGIIACTNLSSPVAYLSSTNFIDPFNKSSANYDQFGRGTVPLGLYNTDMPASLIYENSKLYWTVEKKAKLTPPQRPAYYLLSLGPDYSKGPNPIKNERPDPSGQTGWQLSSYVSGTDPDGSCRFAAWNYDPSNGSTSAGDILRLP